MSTSNKQLADGLRDAASNLEALAQDYDNGPDLDQRRKVPGVELAAQIIGREAQRLEHGYPTETAKALAVQGTTLRSEIARLRRLLRRTLAPLAHAAALYEEAAEQWQPEIRKLDHLFRDIHLELDPKEEEIRQP